MWLAAFWGGGLIRRIEQEGSEESEIGGIESDDWGWNGVGCRLEIAQGAAKGSWQGNVRGGTMACGNLPWQASCVERARYDGTLFPGPIHPAT